MSPAKNMEDALRELRFKTSCELDSRILADASKALAQSRVPESDAGKRLWRDIMKNNWMKLSTAAAVIALAVISVGLFNRSAVPAYAIEQTLEANRLVRHVHVKIDPAGKGLAEAWAQFDEQGKPLQLRLEFPDTEDGPKTTIWRGDKAEVWLKAKKAHVIVNEPMALSKLAQVFELFDPRLGFESAYRDQAEGKVKLEIQTPANAMEPLVLTAISLPDSEWKQVYKIDPASKRVLEFEKYRLIDGQHQFLSRFAYSYDEEFAPDLFVLNPPADVVLIDQTRQDIGVPREGLSDQELAVKVAREFFEALIAQDYNKAGCIFEGMPGERLQKALGSLKFIRIVSIGTPTPHPNARTRFLCVPCEVEVSKDGVTGIQKFTPNIRGVHNQPDRWVIGGGI